MVTPSDHVKLRIFFRICLTCESGMPLFNVRMHFQGLVFVQIKPFFERMKLKCPF